jgi:hypothetical protein
VRIGLDFLCSLCYFLSDPKEGKEAVAMSNMLGIIIGIVVVLVGLVLLVAWWTPFVLVLKGIIPVVLILVGAAALAYFVSEIKSKLELGREDDSLPKDVKPE